jgi:ketosteroid isomerase-like protein
MHVLKPVFGLLAAALLMGASAPDDALGEPYRLLIEGNEQRDAELAASAYTDTAILTFDVPNQPEERYEGRAQIAGAFARTFGQVDAGTPLDLSFRFVSGRPRGGEDKGVYRVVVQIGGKPLELYGHFTVRLVRDGDHWRFAADHGRPATAADYAALPEFAG